MRIAILAWRDLAHPQAGGSEVVVDHLARGLSVADHQVTLFAGGPVKPRSYEIVSTGATYSQYLRAPLALRRSGREFDVVLDVQNGIPFFAPVWWPGPVVCLVHHVHTAQWEQHFGLLVARVGQVLERFAMPWAYRRHRFISISASTTADLAKLGIRPESISTIAMGTTDEARLEVAAPASEPSDEPLFVALGRLVAHKRIDLLLQMWEEVRPQVGGELVIAGDGPYLAKLRRDAGPGVRLMGAVSEEVKQDLLARAWLLVHPSQHEGWGVVINEAASQRTPAVGFDVSGVRDAIVHNETGVLARCESEYIDHWVALTRDAPRRERLGEAAARRAAARQWPAAIEDVERTLRAAVEQWNAR